MKSHLVRASPAIGAIRVICENQWTHGVHHVVSYTRLPFPLHRPMSRKSEGQSRTVVIAPTPDIGNREQNSKLK